MYMRVNSVSHNPHLFYYTSLTGLGRQKEGVSALASVGTAFSCYCQTGQTALYNNDA